MSKNKKIRILVICFMFFFISPNIAFAEGSDYSVVPLLPKSQLEETRSYFDFSVVNQDIVELGFQIENLSEEEQTFSIDIYDAATNKNGIIDYSNTNLKENVKENYRLSDIVTLPDKITVAGHSKETVKFQIKPHKSEFDGYILGALQIVPQKEAKKAGITNLFTRTIAIRMWGSDAEEKIKSKTTDNKKTFDVITEKNTILRYQLVNEAPKIEKEYDVQTIIEKQDGKKKVIHKNDSKMDFAPSSMVEKELVLKEALADGHYKLSINTKTAEGESSHFEYAFQMKNGQLSQHNYWLYGVVLLIALLIILSIILWKKKKEKEHKYDQK